MRSLSAALLLPLVPVLPMAAAPTLQTVPRLPVLFERNSGASAEAFPVRTREKGYELFLGRGGMQIQAAGARPVAIRFGNAAAENPQLAEPSAAVLNDYRGSRANWKSGTPTWQAAEYRSVYTGIDLRFYGSNGDVEYDARVNPGADPSQIEFSFEGAAPRLTSAGDLAIPMGRDHLTWRKPVAYQMIDGRKVPVEARFEVHGKRVGFHLGKWDKSRELIIDPTLTFSTFLGGSGSEFARAIAVDASGNVYITGATSSGDLPVNAASYQSAYKGGGFGSPQDAFVAKLNPTGTAVSYITYLGGTGIDWGLAIAADSGGDAFVTGFTDSPDFPTSAGAYQTRFGGDGGSGINPTGDAFVTKFDLSGKLVWSTYLGGAQDDAAGAIALDSAGDVIVGGATVSPTFPVTSGALQTHYAGAGGTGIQVSTQGWVITNSGDAFIAKLDPTGTKLLASTFLGGTGNDLIDALTLDPQGNIWVGGATASNNFPVSSLAFQHTFGGISNQNMQAIVQLGDGFVSELNGALSQLIYSTYIGGLYDDAVTGIAADAAGNVYVTGFTQSANFPTKGASPGSFQGPAAPAGDTPYLLGDAFAAKLSANGGLQFSEYIGGSGDDAAGGLTLDSQGNMIVVGMTNSKNFPVTTGAMQAGFGGSGSATFGSLGDGFLTQINGSTGAAMYSTYIGGGSGEALAGVAQSTGGFTYIVGNSSSANFPATTGVLQPALNTKVSGNSDAVIMRFSFVAATSPTIGGVTNGASYATTTFSPGEIVTVFGQNMGPAQVVTAAIDPATSGLATTLTNAQVLFDGVPAPLVYVSATQSSALVPYEVAGKSSTMLTVSYNGVASSPFRLQLAPASPGLFAANQQGTGQGAIVNQDLSFNSASHPAPAGSVIELYGTGEGLLSPAGGTGRIAPAAPPFPAFANSLAITIGGIPVPASSILYAGPVPGFVEGEFQINLQLPSNVPSGNQPVVVTIGGFPSQSNLTVAIQ